MKLRPKNLRYTVTGLSLGLVGTLYGMLMSSAIETTFTLFFLVTLVWCAVSAGIISRILKQSN